MTITLHVDPIQEPLTWEDFCAVTPEFSMALDGYVKAGPMFLGTRANFNHHEGCNRLATKSTSAQVLMAIRQGLFKTFRTAAGPEAHAYANDCDEDVCTAWFFLKNHHLVLSTMNPLLNRLAFLVDALDSTAGAYPFPVDLPALRELAWIFQPYREFRLSGGLEKKNPTSFMAVIENVVGRMGLYVVGKGQEIPLDARYERIGGGPGWVMVKEIGAQARTGMFADGIEAFCSVREKGPDHWVYVIGRLSPYIPKDLIKLTNTLNEIEGCTTDCWGGGDLIMGSPRVGASKIPPTEMAKIIDGI